MNAAKVISVEPCKLTLGVRKGVAGRFVPRHQVLSDYHDDAHRASEMLRAFLFPVKYVGIKSSMLLMLLRIVAAALLAFNGVSLIEDIGMMEMSVHSSHFWGAVEVLCSLVVFAGIVLRPVCMILTVVLSMVAFSMTGEPQVLTSSAAVLCAILTVTGPGRISADTFCRSLLDSLAKRRP